MGAGSLWRHRLVPLVILVAFTLEKLMARFFICRKKTPDLGSLLWRL